VRDVDKVVNFRAPSDAGNAESASIDARVGAYFDLGADLNGPDVGKPKPLPRFGPVETESREPNGAMSANAATGADRRMCQASERTDLHAFTKSHALSQRDSRC